jgi:transcriptional regulator with XRE-family HTH domain
MSEQGKPRPFQPLGIRLKFIRQKLQESLAEVSGAVEIDVETLERFEHGSERPNEDLLMLLISHFGMKDDEAVGLWELAGYDTAYRAAGTPADDTAAKQLPLIMMLSLDTRIVYSDGVNITANPNGIVISFTQNAGHDGQPVPIARVGMSREHAQNVLQVLHQAISQSNYLPIPKALPAPKDQKKPKSDTN